MNTGAAIRSMREQKGITQAELAEKIHVSQPMLCQIERGTKSPSLPLSAEIAAVLGCTVNDILEAAESKDAD